MTSAKSNYLSGIYALKLTLIAKCGTPPERWGSGLMVMLEKNPGVCPVEKLKAILLLEADKNCHNGEIFGQMMLNLVQDEGFIPTEQQADKQKTAEDGIFMKVLKHNISCLKRAPLAQLSVDAANCYDRVHHLILGTMLLAVGVPIRPIIAMLYTIQSMKYFLRTGFGE
jgi:hypothetical protein